MKIQQIGNQQLNKIRTVNEYMCYLSSTIVTFWFSGMLKSWGVSQEKNFKSR